MTDQDQGYGAMREMRELLNRTTEELNKPKTNGGTDGSYDGSRVHRAPLASDYAPADQRTTNAEIGEEYAQRFRDAAAKIAKAIEAQADERLQIAISAVEEAKLHVEKAKKIADDVLAGAEEEGRRAIANAKRLQESVDTLVSLRNKFENE
jgi:hypothetical protein